MSIDTMTLAVEAAAKALHNANAPVNARWEDLTERGKRRYELQVQLVIPHLRAEFAEEVATAIEAERNRHWQQHLTAHPHSNSSSCPADYAARDAYYKAATITRDYGRPTA